MAATSSGSNTRGRAPARQVTPKGRQSCPGQTRDREPARRRRRDSRLPDRIPASDPGHLPPDLRRAPRGAGRRDAAGLRRGVRDRDLLRAFRRREGGRPAARAAGHPGLRQHHLRDVRCRDGCWPSCSAPEATAPVPASCARPASACATRRRWSRSGIISCIRPTPAAVLDGDRARTTPTRTSRRLHRLRRLRRRRRLQAARPDPLRRDRGRDGAGDARRRRRCAASAAPASRPARKWRSVRGEPAPRLMAVNGDEGEPGTFKDRHYLNTDPHRFLEGMLIGAHVVEAADDLHLPARRISGRPRDPDARIAKLPPGGRGCTCAAAPAPISAARNPRCWKASRASAACRGTSRRSRSRSACSAARR